MSSSTDTSFNPYTQDITVVLADGATPLTVSLSFIDANIIYDAGLAINYGAQLGACFVMFFITIILTKSGKRTAPIFTLNILSLLFGFLRMLFKEFYFTSSWVKTYPSVSFDYSAISAGAKVVTVFALIWTLLMLITVAASLALQAHTVVKNVARLLRYLLTTFSVLVVLAAVIVRFVDTIENCIAAMGGTNFFGGTWLQYGALISETIMIAWFCVLFTGKLGYTLYIRKKNGWQQWGAVKILAAMGGCTMLIPGKCN
jgi:pheromone alpha factor receptor